MPRRKNNKGFNVKNIFAQNLARIRKNAGLSQGQLSIKTGLTHNFITDLENQKKSPSFETISRLSEALNTRPFNFFIDMENWEEIEKLEFMVILDELNEGIEKMFDSYRKHGNIKTMRGKK
jgi:transcriptional regulator with XRE-family HTH domain